MCKDSVIFHMWEKRTKILGLSIEALSDREMIKDLGILMDTALNFNQQIEKQIS